MALGFGDDRATGTLCLKQRGERLTYDQCPIRIVSVFVREKIMPAKLEFEDNDIGVLRIEGVLRQPEFAACQAELAKKIDAGSKPRLLVIAENFDGWERLADWNDLDFMISHGGEIAKIALVGDRRWETPALAFAGAGVRRAPVKFFPPDQLAQARVWLAE